MRKMNYRVASVIIGLSLLAQAGCASSKPSRYYLLSALSPAQTAKQDRGVSVGVGPIEFPKYLDRPQIVTRGSQNRLSLGEFDRWAEPLEHNFARVLAENLAALLSTDDVVHYPWKRSARVDYQIIVTVNRFDAVIGGDTVLHARWTVCDGGGHTIIPPRASRIAEPAASADYEAIVQAGSRALEQLGRQIAGAIQSIVASPESERNEP
ncbi:MAG: membrane integrity-associated transporter subunit PqiC [Phycisphaerales bacterium]|nr:MAG: membrane integrity-associated transporter subunit PqiC [Phycisphaerales bacterium]